MSSMRLLGKSVALAPLAGLLLIGACASVATPSPSATAPPAIAYPNPHLLVETTWLE